MLLFVFECVGVFGKLLFVVLVIVTIGGNIGVGVDGSTSLFDIAP